MQILKHILFGVGVWGGTGRRWLDGQSPREAKWYAQYLMDRVKRIWYLSHMRAANVQASLRIRAVSPEPSLLAHTSSESRGTFRQKARSLAPLNVWACAVKICHDGMLEDTNSLDGALIQNHYLQQILKFINMLNTIISAPIIGLLIHVNQSPLPCLLGKIRAAELTKWHVRPAKTQISLGIHPVWSGHPLSLIIMRRLRSTWASTQSDQSLRCPHEESLGP